MRVSTHALGTPDNPPIEVGRSGVGRWGSALRKCPHSTCLNLKLSTNLLETLFGCVRACILSYTTPDACQHALGFAWWRCVPTCIQLAIQTSLREGVVGKEKDNEGGCSSMWSYSTCCYLKLSTKLLKTLLGCVLAHILSYTPSDACQHALGNARCIWVPARIHYKAQTRNR
jgi:hypothetical protein